MTRREVPWRHLDPEGDGEASASDVCQRKLEKEMDPECDGENARVCVQNDGRR